MTPAEEGGSRSQVRRALLSPGRPAPRDIVSWEIEHYLAELTDKLVAEGLSQEEAAAEARRRFGDVEGYRRRFERLQRTAFMKKRTAELRSAALEIVTESLRSIRRQPGLSVAVVLTLGLGLGANTVMFGVLDRLLLRPPAHVVEPEQLRRVTVTRNVPRWAVAELRDLQSHPGFTGVAASGRDFSVFASRGEDAARLTARLVSHTLFPLLGVSPALGRFFDSGDDRTDAPGVVVISHEYWRRGLGGDPNVIGSTLRVAGQPVGAMTVPTQVEPFTIIGVAPPDFTGAELSRPDVWLPLVSGRQILMGNDGLGEGGWQTEEIREFIGSGNGFWLTTVVVRLAPGTRAESAEAEATRLHIAGWQRHFGSEGYPVRAYAPDAPDSARVTVRLAPLLVARGDTPPGEYRLSFWLAGISLFLLVVGSLSATNLLLVRQTRRAREAAVRLALGISLRRLVARILVETLLLGLGAAAVALLTAVWGGALLRSTLLPNVYFPEPLGERSIAFTLMLVVVLVAVAGALPALHAARTRLTPELLREGYGATAAPHRLRTAFTVAQAALSVPLLVGAGLFVRSLSQIHEQYVGPSLDPILEATLHLESSLGAYDASFQNDLHREAIERLEALPGVVHAAADHGRAQNSAIWMPGAAAWNGGEERDGSRIFLANTAGNQRFFVVTDGYLEAMGLRVLLGRALLRSDDASAERVIVVNEAMVRRLSAPADRALVAWDPGDPWPIQDVLGQCISPAATPGGCYTIVGVVEDTFERELIREPQFFTGGRFAGSMMVDATPAFGYIPIAQRPENGGLSSARLSRLIVRVEGDPARLSARVQELLGALSPEIRYVEVVPVRELQNQQIRSWRLGAFIFAAFSLLALIISAIGLYSLLAFHVAQRHRELAVRAALGAGRGRVLGTVLADGGRMTALGVGLGVAITLAAGRFIEPLLFRVSPRDPVVLGSVATVLLIVGLLASIRPGLRAARVDPLSMLKGE